MTKGKKILITGAAGFIGFHTCKFFLERNYEIIGLDNLNDYYSIQIKRDRLKVLEELATSANKNWNFVLGNLEDKLLIENIFIKYKPKIVIHLAAQAGVRYSLTNPDSYINSNIVGFLSILENCRSNNIENLIFASSSSVYGGNAKIPFSENDPVNHPVSLYAATKRSNELMAHCYSHLFKIPSTGLRFFTVYGPWGRPDMAPMIFTKAIISGKPIQVFNNGEMYRDFTYIDDVVTAIEKLLDKPAQPNASFNKKFPQPSNSWSPFRILNVGNSKKVYLKKFINLLELEIGKKAIIEFKDFQPGDVQTTLSSTKELELLTNFKPEIKLEKGIKLFISWYKKYYELS
tara:strand:+ start:3227 stop:4264 length:1038 start_codon:yes stop_codon:yes gene_type:complete